MNQQTFQTKSVNETNKLAATLVNTAPSNIVALIGELGSGKTTLTQAIGEYFEVDSPITSPTFLLMKVYPIPNHKQYQRLVHLDLYRTSSWDEVAELGITEWWDDPANFVVVEWADRIATHFPENTLFVSLEHGGGDTRAISVSTQTINR